MIIHLQPYFISYYTFLRVIGMINIKDLRGFTVAVLHWRFLRPATYGFNCFYYVSSSCGGCRRGGWARWGRGRLGLSLLWVSCGMLRYLCLLSSSSAAITSSLIAATGLLNLTIMCFSSVSSSRKHYFCLFCLSRCLIRFSMALCSLHWSRRCTLSLDWPNDCIF